MQTRSKLLLAALTATVFMALAVTAAQARRIFLNFTRYQAIWTLLRFEVPSVTSTVECPVTLEGSFHSASLTKVSGALIGYVTSAKVGGTRAECLNTGTARINTESLPWHMRYLSFIGELPRITGITLQLVGANFNVQPAGRLNCNARTTAANPGVGIAEVNEEAGGFLKVNRLRADETRGIPIGGEFFCELAPGNSFFRGTAEVFTQAGTTRILVRLIQ